MDEVTDRARDGGGGGLAVTLAWLCCEPQPAASVTAASDQRGIPPPAGS